MYLLVGASGAVGSEVLRVLREAGESCLVTNRSAMASLESSNPVPSLPLDLSSPDSISQFVRAIRSNYPRLSGVVLTSGEAFGSTIQMARVTDISRVIQVNAIGPVDLARRLLPHLSEGASVVFLSSVASTFAQRGNGIYGASKILLERLAQALALEVERPSARIHLLRPGAIQSPMFMKMSAESREELLSRSENHEGASPAEVAKVVSFLLSPHSMAISSGCITLDAGHW